MASLLETPVAGTEQARFERLYAEHRRVVYATALRLLGNPDDAEDSTQAAFLRAYRSLERGATPRQPRAWLLAILRNVCRDHWRESSLARRNVELDDEAALADREEGAVAAAELVEAIDRLEGPQRSVFLLREIRGLGFTEVAARLGLSESSVRALIVRARTALRGELEAGERGFSCLEAQGLLKTPLHELEPAERRLVRAHLRGCGDCARLARRSRARRAVQVLVFPVDGLKGVLRWLGFMQGGGGATKLALLAAVGSIGTATTMAIESSSPAPTLRQAPAPVAAAAVHARAATTARRGWSSRTSVDNARPRATKASVRATRPGPASAVHPVVAGRPRNDAAPKAEDPGPSSSATSSPPPTSDATAAAASSAASPPRSASAPPASVVRSGPSTSPPSPADQPQPPPTSAAPPPSPPADTSVLDPVTSVLPITVPTVPVSVPSVPAPSPPPALPDPPTLPALPPPPSLPLPPLPDPLDVLP